jgi:predicted transcriptional regulator of viral defense system
MAEKKIFENKIDRIRRGIENLPYFSIDDLATVNTDKDYLKKTLSRLIEKGEIVSLKRGMYVSKIYLEEVNRKNKFNDYSEFIGNIVYDPSYLSTEYVLEKYGVLSEGVVTLTSVSIKKTNKFSNDLGVFKYFNIKEKLFTGFEIKTKGDFLIAEASLAKALFDFLYYRKNILFTEDQIDELRLNLDVLTKKDFVEMKEYIVRDNSKRMQKIFNYLIKEYGKNNSRAKKNN